jgi:N-acetylmuramoyl-L-alanine amidase
LRGQNKKFAPMRRFNWRLLWVCSLFWLGMASRDVPKNWLTHTVVAGEFAEKIFARYELQELDKTKFWELNNIANKDKLLLGKTYTLPIQQFPKTQQNIRQTVGIQDYNHALSIQKWNEKLEKKGIKQQRLQQERMLWVRWSDLPENTKASATKQDKSIQHLLDPRLLGTNAADYQLKDSSLHGACFYLISGHGGPDPGANLTKNGHFITEDEYAYDVTLRLAVTLAQKGAKIFMIVQDFSHAIRNEPYLKHDKNEKVYPNKIIPLNQIQRLKQRTDVVNELYAANKNKYTYHRCIEIHIDSRSKKEPIDVFFYHYPGSVKGMRLNENLQQTFKEKYAKYQKGRGYTGEIFPRKLYSLVHTNPVMSYIELGNIQHERDLKRILVPENRQHLAEWLAEGLLKDKKADAK